jgi:hypothetical protein
VELLLAVIGTTGSGGALTGRFRVFVKERNRERESERERERE